MQRLNKIAFEVVARADNKKIGTGVFNAKNAASGPVSSAASAVQNTTQAETMGASTLVPIDLELNLKASTKGQVTLTVSNNDKGQINLAHFKFNVNGHLMLRPTQTNSVKMTGMLKPGSSSAQIVDPFGFSACANFTHYSAIAEGSGLNFTTRLDVPPVTLELNKLAIRFDQINAYGEISEMSFIDIIADVKNTSHRQINSITLEGIGDIQTDKGHHFFRFS